VKNFGHKRPVRDEAGKIVDFKSSPAQAITLEALGGAFGPDRKHRLIVTLAEGDLIILRPARTTRPISVAAKDVYRFALLCRANLANLEKARAAKARKAERLAAARVARAERRLFPKPRHTPGPANGEPMIGANWKGQP
jgi:hypothetical protein